MKARKTGSRHMLLLYKRVMDRLWKSTLFLGLLTLGIWGWGWFSPMVLIEAQNSVWLLAGSTTLLGFTLFAFFGRNMAYIQAHPNHLRLVTPFLRTNISYKRIRSVHPANFHQLYPPEEASWAEKRLLEPFYGKTTVLIELHDFPIPPFFLRLFLAPQMFSKGEKGLVLLVPDWMAFSTEIDSFRARQPVTRRQQGRVPGWLR